jgi:HD domain
MRRSRSRNPETEDFQTKIDSELHLVGLEHFSEAIAQRMKLIEVLAARFNNDSRIIRRMCLEVIDRIASTLEPERRSMLDAETRRDMSIAAYLHDIGKSGPFDASQRTQEAIVKLYAVENVASPDQTIAETVRANFSSEEATSILEHLGSCGMRDTDTMRAFWDRHGYWTHDILEGDSEDIPMRARVVAGSHHLDRGIDPYGVSTDDDAATLESRILMAVDKYQAAVVRGRKTHGEAMDLTRRILSPKYGNDAMMTRVLQVLDVVGAGEMSFAEAA